MCVRTQNGAGIQPKLLSPGKTLQVGQSQKVQVNQGKAPQKGTKSAAKEYKKRIKSDKLIL
jgi:carbonic anhydrase/acetyltransferase-like protein (isoleucine patch superfamily)